MTTKKNKEGKEDEAIQIVLRPSEIKVLSWRNIELFQPNGFKVGNTDGIWKSIANNDLLDKFKVFQIPGSKKYFMFDGHTRKKLMIEKEEDGIAKFPDTMECEVFQFKTKQEAAKSLLEYQAGKLKISESGLIEFADKANVEYTDFIEIVNDLDIQVINPDQIDIGHNNGDGDTKENNKYTRKIEVPIYEPINKKPTIQEMIDTTKTNLLISSIKEADLPEELMDFLIHSANRHTVFNYSKIADYYAHSEKAIQKLMEDSALVVIDFNRAIELGFAKISNKYIEEFIKQQGEDAE